MERKNLKVAVVGLGLIGGSMALAMRANGFASEIVGVEEHPIHREQALNLKIVDRFAELNDVLPTADLVILAVPVNNVSKMLNEVLNLVGSQTTVTDVGSTKERIAKVASTHPRREQFVPSHPMAGTENSGPAAAFKDLFRGKTAVICDFTEDQTESVKKVQALYQCLEMRCVYMTSAQHDLHVAFVSHLSHISSFVLANTVLDIERNTSTIFDLAGGGFESTVRLAKSSPEMWVPIFEQNEKNISEALQAYILHLQHFQKVLTEQRWREASQILTHANEIRRVLQTMSVKGVGASFKPSGVV